MKSILLVLALISVNSFAQLDRAGNVIDDGGGSGSGIGLMAIGALIGAVLGAVYAKGQQAKGKEFATEGGAVIGGFIGLVAVPFLAIVLKL